jgi:hypothetical protein
MSIYISHMITSFISSTIYCFMTKNIARKTIAKKEILVTGCESEWPSWWKDSSEFILVVLVRRIRFLLVVISFIYIVFIVDGSF